uniref:Rrn7/TAF1B C-terminal cyclin domain-containing protein n=1 Tax=Anopheles farauti TaxID=69004 RepID=A0A182QZX1_9DIPT
MDYLNEWWKWVLLQVSNRPCSSCEGLDPACLTQTTEQLSTGYQGLLYCRVITSMMGTDLGILPVEPDIVAVSERYLSELALPLDLLPFIRKLIAIAPPIRRNNLRSYFPSYELHAMKYVLFVMKLLFGLDGVIETKLDAATKKLNNRLTISSCNRYETTSQKCYKWMKQTVITYMSPNICM